jgi:D-glycero-alpha-D-manno-heptose-7-phosphate kinase
MIYDGGEAPAGRSTVVFESHQPLGGSEPTAPRGMVVSQTPLRISFAGGGTDLPSYYLARGYGVVVSATIRQHLYVIVHTNRETGIRLRHGDVVERVDRAEDLSHRLAREALLHGGLRSGVDLTILSDVPANGTGLGSSSALAVGLMHAILAARGEPVPPTQLAASACHLEIERLGSPIGKQDQYATAHGGLNFIRFNANGSVDVEPLRLEPLVFERLERSLLAFYLGPPPPSNEILGKIWSRDCGSVVERLDASRDQALALRETLLSGDVDRLGDFLHENWLVKRGLSDSVSRPDFDRTYEAARTAGASGGKLCGAGGGGYLLLYVRPEYQAGVRKALAGFHEMDISISSHGSRLTCKELA